MSCPRYIAKPAFFTPCSQISKRDGNAMRFSDRTCKVTGKQQHTTEIHPGYWYGSYKAFFFIIAEEKSLVSLGIYFSLYWCSCSDYIENAKTVHKCRTSASLCPLSNGICSILTRCEYIYLVLFCELFSEISLTLTVQEEGFFSILSRYLIRTHFQV